MKHKYGNFLDNQMDLAIHRIRKSIFYLLLIADPQNKSKYKHVDVNDAFTNLLYELDGLNELLSYPVELVRVSSMLEKARMIYSKDNFNFMIYRKLILDAGNEVLRIRPKGGDI